METLMIIAEEYHKKLHAINQLTLTGWCALSKELGVAGNDREHAAKILALRSLRAAGKID